VKCLLILVAGLVGLATDLRAQVTQPIVAIHDSELTRALESMTATSPTPNDANSTGKQWWPRDWHYFVMPEALKEALRSDGTAFTVVGDSNITAGVLLSNGVPKFPIVFSLASEAIRPDEIAQFTNYVAAGGFLFVGSSAFTRNTNGTTRNDFAFANQMGVHMVTPGLTNWTTNFTLTKLVNHRLVMDLPSDQLIWRMPASSDEISWGVSPAHNFSDSHDLWKVSAGAGATTIVSGDNYPFLVIKPYGKGYFIYHAAFQPLIGHGGFGPGMYAYMILRRAIEWAFETVNQPVPKLSPWPYQYDAAFMVRHDLENYTNEMARISASAQAEFNAGAKGDYYFCTGTIRDDTAGTTQSSIISNLRQAVTSYGATLGPHNGGLKNPVNTSLVRGDYDYWHWGPDEALDVTPAGYASGKMYAMTSLSNSFKDVEGWLSGITNGIRTWVACYFNATREDSYDIQSQLGVNITGDQKISPFPHWTLSTETPNKRYRMLSQPVSDWYINGMVAQSMEPWHPPAVHTSQTVHDAVDYYYNLGALINIYSHQLSTGLLADGSPSPGNAYLLVPDYINYCVNSNLHPKIWSANAVLVYQWWLQRSNAQISVNYSTNGYQSIATLSVAGSTSTNTAVEVLLPGTNAICNLQVLTNGVAAGSGVYRTVTNLLTGQRSVRVRVGTSVNTATISYFPFAPTALIFSENFDGTNGPGLPAGWSTSASGAQSPWVAQVGTNTSAPTAAYSADATNIGINQLVSPPIVLPAGQAVLTFANNYDLETGAGTNGYDGGVLEIKIGTNAFTDIVTAGGSFLSGGYTSVIDNHYGNPLANRPAWSGSSGGYVPTVVTLPPAAAGQIVQLQWRCGTDDGNGHPGWRIDSVTVSAVACLCCVGTNTSPVLPGVSDRTVVEGATLSVTNTATDADVPAQTLTYILLNPPGGATISSSGIITWQPSESQGPGTYTLTTIVTDSGSPPMSDTNSFNVTVAETNSPPVLTLPGSQTILEQVPWSANATATDTDVPPNTLAFALVSGPAGLTVSSSGAMAWTPSEAQGPSTNMVTVRVSDNGTPTLSVTNSFTLTVSESNTPPILPLQANRTLAPLTSMTVTNTATDADLPSNTLTYSLLSPPSFATIQASSGVITLTPSLAQNNSTNVITTVVTDFNPQAVNAQHLSATNSFSVVVSSAPQVILDSAALVAEGCFPTNNAIDPGETVMVSFALKNVGNGNTTNLVVTLLQTNGVAAPSGPQTYGVLLVNGNAVTQAFSLTATGACGGSISATLQLQDGASSLGTLTATFGLGPVLTVLTQSFDTVTAPALPSGWTTFASGAQANWFTTNLLSDTGPNAAYSGNAANVGVNELDSPPFVLPNGPSQLSFRNRYDLEGDSAHPTNAYDGGVLEIKIGTNAFVDITNAGGVFLSGGYSAKISSQYSNVLGGRWCWSGNSGGYVTTVVAMPSAAAGQTVQLRWRCGTDSGTGDNGWRIDGVAVTGNSCCANTPPALPEQHNRTIPELSTMTVTNTATGMPGRTLSYQLLIAPTNAVISTNGVITWTPGEEQGPSVNNVFTTVVTDSGIPPLSDTNTFSVNVMEVNSAPTLSVPADQAIDELVPWTATATATDPDVPADNLTFVLVSGPAGLTVSTNGVINWTPNEFQGPHSFLVKIRVYDDGSPALGDTESFTLTVREVNSAPTLSLPASQSVDELALWTGNATAVDTDFPANDLTFELVSGPANFMCSPGGAMSWTPSESQGPGTYTVTVRVFDDGIPSLSATNSFQLTVDEVNSVPILTVPADQTIDEQVLWTGSATAMDSDLPANMLTFELVAGPTGLTVSSNGVISWTPTEAQGPSTNLVTVRVFDGGTPRLNATNSFTLTVAEANTAPTLTLPPDQTISEEVLWTANAVGTDADLPANVLTYELVSGPIGLTVSTNGVMSWTPTEAQGPSTNVVTVRVFDDGTPSLSATNSFTVTVAEANTAPTLTLPPDQTISEEVLWTANAVGTDSDLPANVLTYELVSGPVGLMVSTNGVIGWTPTEAQGPSTNVVTVRVFDDGTPSLSATNSFTLTVVEANTAPTLTLPPDQTISEEVLWTANAIGTDTDLPANVLTYELVSGPVGLTVSTNGVISWTPTEAQGPSTNVVTVRVSDDGTPSLSATNSFTVTVAEANTAPTLTLPPDQAISEEVLWTANAVGTDSDLPANVLTYELVSGPVGLTVSTNGVISWTPTEAQGPSTNVVTVRVSDDGTPSLSATNSFTVTVAEANTAPTLTLPPDQTISEEVLWTANAVGADADLPANVLTYELVSGPVGLTVSSNGVMSWTPTEAQGPSTNVVTVRVFDDGTPSLSATNSFTLTVAEANTAPTLTLPPDQTISEEVLWTANAVGTDADLPANVLTYELVSGPVGLTVSSNGVMSWTPTEAQGPSTNVVTVRVSDDGTPSLSATNSFTVTVAEANTAPTLTLPPDQTISEEVLWTANAVGTDSDLPANVLTYELVSGPVGLTVSTNGVISWTPTEAQGPSTNIVTVRVSDDGSPALSATNSFSLVVLEVNTAPVLPILPDLAIDDVTALTITNTAMDADLPANGLTYILLAGPTNAVVDANGVITWTPSPAQAGSTNTFVTEVTDDGIPPLSATNTFRVVVSAPKPGPFMASIVISNGTPIVTWDAVPGRTYKLQYKDNLSDTEWIDVLPDVTATGAKAAAGTGETDALHRYYRVMLVP
jgi:hypothetical protein